MASNSNSKIAVINGMLFYKNNFIEGTVLIENDKIKKVITGIKYDMDLSGYKIIDAAECMVSYGFFDPHVHFRTPGAEHKEDWESGTNAAVKGGFTFVADMPNTNPPAVDYDSMKIKYDIARKSFINFGFYLGITDDNVRHINKICKKLKRDNIPVLGLKCFLGSSTGSLLIKKEDTVKNALKTGLICLFHSEDEDELKKYDQIPYNSIYDHNRKRPPEAALASLIKIAKSAKKIIKSSRIYICHVSSFDEIRLIKKLKKKGYNIKSEITPHHLFFDLMNIKNSNIYKVNPPIRSTNDAAGARKMFNRGFFDIIGTDHAPHLLSEKDSSNPPSGMPGLESAFYALYDLYERDIISLKRAFKLFISGYKIFGIKKRGRIKSGYYADLVIIKKTGFVFKASDTATKSDFSPFDGLRVQCRIDTVLINGKMVLENGELVKKAD